MPPSSLTIAAHLTTQTHLRSPTLWRSGYLPGEDYGYLPFFFGLAVVYLALGVTWMIVCMAYIKVSSGPGNSLQSPTYVCILAYLVQGKPSTKNFSQSEHH